MSLLSEAELLLQAKNYSGSGDWLDESGNGHDAQLGSTSGADTNDPLFLPFAGSRYVYFPGSANNQFTVAGLSATTTYDFTVTYEDDTTADGTEDSDGSGNLVLGNTQPEFAGLKVKDVTVVPDGGGAEVAGINASAFTEPFTSATGRQGLTWTINRASSGRVSTVVDRDMFLLGTDDYFEVADAAGLDFAADESFTVMVVSREYNTLATNQEYVSKWNGTVGWLLRHDTAGRVLVFIDDGTADDFDLHPGLPLGEAHVSAGRRDVSADDLEAFLDGDPSGSPTTDTTTATLATSTALSIGRLTGSANYLSGEIHAVALWREALTDAEIAQAGEELLLLLPDAPAHRRRRKYLLRTRGRAR